MSCTIYSRLWSQTAAAYFTCRRQVCVCQQFNFLWNFKQCMLNHTQLSLYKFWYKHGWYILCLMGWQYLIISSLSDLKTTIQSVIGLSRWLTGVEYWWAFVLWLMFPNTVVLVGIGAFLQTAFRALFIPIWNLFYYWIMIKVSVDIIITAKTKPDIASAMKWGVEPLHSNVLPYINPFHPNMILFYTFL